ncbi:hypothetical protein LTR22_028081 [Elasticomyces elasticus]|nr:hypothetical protein LTR22_028081 [Elasticomyces elasticus]
MSTEIRDGTRYKQAANAVATTWIISFNQILEQNAEVAGLLRLTSYIEWKAIPDSFLPCLKSEAQMKKAIGTLCSYSFFTGRHEEENAKISSLVVSKNTAGSRRNIYRHAARARTDAVGTNVDGNGELYMRVGHCLKVDGKSKDAVSWLKESCRDLEALTEDHPDRLTSQHELAREYQAHDITDAVKLLEHVATMQKEMLAEDHPDRLASQNDLVRAFQANGQVKEVVEPLEHVGAMLKEVPADDHPSRLASAFLYLGSP